MAFGPALALVFSLHATSGLFMHVSGVPAVRGSWFQYHEPDWSKGYFTTLYMTQKIDRFETGVVRYTFKSNDGRAFGDVTYIPTPNSLKAEYRFNWSGERRVHVELAAGLIWIPAVQNGKLIVNGKPQRNLFFSKYRSENDYLGRRYGDPSGSILFDGAIGKLSFTSTTKDWIIFDGRGTNQDWSSTNDLLWLGIPDLEVVPGKTRHISAEWRFEPTPQHGRAQVDIVANTKRLPIARDVDQPYPVIPKPKFTMLDKGREYILGLHPDVQLPETCDDIKATFQSFYEGLWNDGEGKSGTIVGQIADLRLSDEGYVINVNSERASVTGQSKQGLLNGLYTLALMAYPNNGRLVVPSGNVRDWPSIDWRGIHLFVGPEAYEFHHELFAKVLRPMKINKVVLQCERTAWDATKGIETSLTTSKEALVKEFNFMRRIGIEPIPLIESFGHTEWLFANNQNTDLALNPELKYAIDPRVPRARELMKTLWEEVVALLKPQTIHFGMDEVAIVGTNNTPLFVTEMWQGYMPFLMKIASTLEVKPMLWGDVGLAKGQAPDACNGDSEYHAKKRRDILPQGTYVADWHYSPNPDPDAFAKSLRLWKSEGKVPIASTWFNPINIRNFVTAASREKCGALQTTWAGFESNWRNFFREYAQHSAYVTFADYAWSGRIEEPNALGYDAGRFMRRLLMDAPGNVEPAHGHSWIPSNASYKQTRLGGYVFNLFTPIALRSKIDLKQLNAPTIVTIRGSIRGKWMVLAVDCQARCEEYDPVADIEIELDNGKTVTKTLLYGQDIRSQKDTGSIVRADRSQGMSLIKLSLGTTEMRVKKITLKASNVYSGLRLRGVTTY